METMDKQVIDHFNSLLCMNDQDKINQYFTGVIINISTDAISYMVHNGADPMYLFGTPFIRICHYGTFDKIKYFIDEFVIDDNVKCGSDALIAVLNNPYVSDVVTTIKYLLDSGFVITDRVIEQCIYGDRDDKFIKLFVEYGFEIERIGQIFWKHYATDYDFIVNNILYLSKFGLDLNQSINQFGRDIQKN